MKFVLFVEGYTERDAIPSFLKRWLDPQLQHPVGIKPVRFEGWRNYEGEIAKKVALHLSGRSGKDVIAAIGLLDLYGPTFYPSHIGVADERVVWAKKHLEDKVNNARFTQHFAVHELEAWLLATPNILPTAVSKALPGKAAKPETVNFNEPPAKLLERLYTEKLKRHYHKVIDGVDLFGALDPAAAYDKCPQLKSMLDEMLRRAKEAGL